MSAGHHPEEPDYLRGRCGPCLWRFGSLGVTRVTWVILVIAAVVAMILIAHHDCFASISGWGSGFRLRQLPVKTT